MPRGLSNQPDGDRSRGAASSSHAPSFADAHAPRSCERGEYLEKRRRLVADLTRCHDEAVVIGPLLKELPSISQLERTFSFRDALELSLHEHSNHKEDQAAHVLKTKMAAAVQSLAGRVDSICQNSEQREAFIGRLARQFQHIQSTLIHQEQQQCAVKLEALCDRLDNVVEQLALLPDRALHHEAFLRGMSQALRSYTVDRLGQATIDLSQTDNHERRGQSQMSLMTIPEFLNLLDNLIVETLYVYLDQAAA